MIMDNQPVQQPNQDSNPTTPTPAVAQPSQPQAQTQSPAPTQPSAPTDNAAASSVPTAQPLSPQTTEPVNTNSGQQAGWKFEGNNPSTSSNPSLSPQTPATTSIPADIAWSASEYVHHEKDAKWYFAYSGISISILAVVYLLTKDLISVGILAVLAVGFGVFAARKPETLDYRIDASGVHIGPKLYPITMFKSFAVVEEGSINSIALMPLKRFMPPITMYCAPEDEKKVEQALGAMLPQETREQDRVDRLMHKVGF